MKSIIPLKLAALILSLCLVDFCFAQMPVLLSEGQETKNVYLQKLDIDVKITGSIATTTWTMTFKNTTSRTLEGELKFPLQNGNAVSAYALDINGKLRDAVPVEKAKATQVLEAIERRRIDPGLLEKVDGTIFRTRIYPINPHNTRTVRIQYDEDLPFYDQHSLVHSLPFAFKNKIEDFSIQISVFQNTAKPLITENLEDELSFKEWNNYYSASKTLKNYVADQPLAMRIPKQSGNTEILMQQSGNHYTYLVNTFLKKDPKEKSLPANITILWDASLSGLNRNIKKELNLLSNYFEKLNNVNVTLVTFSNIVQSEKQYKIKNGDWAEMRTNLENTIYDGGTQLGMLNLAKWPADEFLLFSDGHSTYNRSDIVFTKSPVYCINSSAKADFPSLVFITQTTRGVLIDLTQTQMTDARRQLLYEPYRFLGIKEEADVEESYPHLSAPVTKSFSIAGISYSPKKEITLLFGYGNKVTDERKVTLDFEKYAIDNINLSRIWAQKKIAELDIRHDNNKETIEQLGKQLSIVTRNTSLMVLENITDYVQYEIEPPAELRHEYDELIKQRSQLREQRIVAAGNKAEYFFNELVNWWKTDFKPIKNFSPKTDTINSVEASLQRRATSTTGALQGRAAGVYVRGDRSAESMQSTAESNKLSEVVVVAYGTQRKSTITGASTSIVYDAEEENKPDDANSSDKNPAGTFTLKAFTNDSSYVDAINKETTVNRYEKYLSLRKKYIDMPVFYFNVACYFFNKNEKQIAVRILSNIAELDAENYELYKLLAYKLKQEKEYKAELAICRKVLQWRPMDPQSYRDLALALEDNGYYQQALDTLYTAITNNYAENINSMYNGIEETILPEINRLIALKKNDLNINNIPRKLIQSMPVDVRVVLNWNMNDTDIDLWITDPNKERCYYSHKTTAVGGRLSNDFTNGFGPEEFMLKKAVKGKYKVEIDYFGDTQQKIAGPTTVMAEIFTNYGSPNEKRQIITLQMKKDAKGQVMVGEFEF